MLKKLSKWIPEDLIPVLAVHIVLHAVSYWLPMLIVLREPADLTTAWDRSIPVLPWTTLIYTGAFAAWIIGLLLILRGDRRTAVRFLICDALNKIVSASIFLAFPMTCVQPELGTEGLSWLLAIVYACDKPLNLFPSLHCSLSWAIFRAIGAAPGCTRRARLGWGICCVLICLSTLTTKQHVLADVAGGVLLAELCWQAGGMPAVRRLYCRILHLEERV